MKSFEIARPPGWRSPTPRRPIISWKARRGTEGAMSLSGVSGGDLGEVLERVGLGRETDRAHERRVGDELRDLDLARRPADHRTLRARHRQDALGEVEDLRAHAAADVHGAGQAVLDGEEQRVD